MLSTKSVLPNFLKSLVIASMTLASVSAFAGHHEEGEKKIGELKDMSSDAAKIKAEDMTDKIDAAGHEKAMDKEVMAKEAMVKDVMDKDVMDKEAMTKEAKKMMDDKVDEMAEKAMEVKPN